jgi:hypothetical protein
MKGRIAAAAATVLVVALSGCSWGSGMADSSPLTTDQMGYATAIAHSEIEKYHSDIRTAVADIHAGVVRGSGSSCKSGSLLRITLIGTFHASASSDEGGPSVVHAEVIEADPATGHPCLTGMKVGHVSAPKGAVDLPGLGS